MQRTLVSLGCVVVVGMKQDKSSSSKSPKSSGNFSLASPSHISRPLHTHIIHREAPPAPAPWW